MKALFAASLSVALCGVPSFAFADDEPPPDTAQEAPKKEKDALHVTPLGAWFAGQWMGVPVTRVAGGLGLMVVPRKQPIAFDGSFIVASGETENGLSAKRVEIGGAISSLPGLFRIAGGAHLSVAWLTRRTMTGTIGGIGIGMHALAELAIPLGEVVALTAGVRGSVDAYDGGIGYEGGPFAGLRF